MPLNKIRVHDLCANARINKSTFYRHYADVFELSDKLERETVDGIMRDFAAVDLLFVDPEEFLRNLLEAVERHSERIKILFSGRANVLAERMEARLSDHYLSPAHTPEDDITMAFLVGGATHVFMNPKYDTATATRTLGGLLKSIPAGRI